MKYDLVRETVGEFGRWQMLVSFLLGLYGLMGCIVSIDTVFTAARPASWCRVPRHPDQANLTLEQWRNLTVPWEWHQGAWRRHPCKAYGGNVTAVMDVQADAYGRAVTDAMAVTDRTWNLVCEQSYLVSVTKSVAMAGMMIGAGLGGLVADRIGRRRTIIIALPGVVLARVVVAFSPNLIVYNVCNFISILSSSAAYAVSFTLAVELVGPSRRALVGTWPAQAFALGYLLLVLLAYFIRSWKLLAGTIAALTTPFFAAVCIIPESPRWLLASGKTKEAHDVLRRKARLNGRPLPEDFVLPTNIQSEKVGRERLYKLCTYRSLACRNIVLFFAWFVAALVYYGLTLNVGSLAGSVYVNLAVAGVLELLAYGLSQVVISSPLGRRLPTAALCALAGLCLLLTLVVPADKPIGVTTLTTIGRFCVSCYFNCIYIWTVELLPTSLRNSGLSINSCLGKLGAVIAPFTEQLGSVHPVLPVVTLGAAAVVCGLLLLILPETRGRPLPQTLADILKLSEGAEEAMGTADGTPSTEMKLIT